MKEVYGIIYKIENLVNGKIYMQKVKVLKEYMDIVNKELTHARLIIIIIYFHLLKNMVLKILKLMKCLILQNQKKN